MASCPLLHTNWKLNHLCCVGAQRNARPVHPEWANYNEVGLRWRSRWGEGQAQGQSWGVGEQLEIQVLTKIESHVCVSVERSPLNPGWEVCVSVCRLVLPIQWVQHGFCIDPVPAETASSSSWLHHFHLSAGFQIISPFLPRVDPPAPNISRNRPSQIIKHYQDVDPSRPRFIVGRGSIFFGVLGPGRTTHTYTAHLCLVSPQVSFYSQFVFFNLPLALL